MMKYLLMGAGVVLVLVGAFFVLNQYIYDEKQGVVVESHKNGSYVINGEVVTLTDGVSEVPVAPGSASKVVTKYFGNEVRHDIDGDGRSDTVFIITQETGGSGVFYYAVGALSKETGVEGTQAVFLGDRIAPQTTEVGKGKIVVVNYADRAPGEPFTTAPSVGKSIHLLLDPETRQFGEVVQNFEGEVDMTRLSLLDKEWVWIKTLYNDEREITPKTKGSFVLTFLPEQRFSVKTDCNRLAGGYAADESTMSFKDMISTKMYCQGSQESEFSQMLSNISGYHFGPKGELILDIKFDSGSMIFQ